MGFVCGGWNLPGRKNVGIASVCAPQHRRLPMVMLLNGKPKSPRPKLRKGYKPPRLTRQLRWALEDLEELVLKRRFQLAYEKFVDITKLDITPEQNQYNDLILLMGLMGVEDAELVLEDMKTRQFEVKTVTMNEIIKVHGRRRDPEGIRATLKRIDDMGLNADGDTIWAMVEGFVKSNDIKGGVFALEEAKTRRVWTQIGTFVARMRFHSFIGNVDEVEEAFFEMTEQYGHFPTVYAYNLRIASFAAKGEAFAAEETLKEMKILGRLKPNEMTYRILIKMYLSLGNLEEAKSMFEKMQGESLVATASTFSSLTRSIRLEEEREQIENVLLEMQRYDPHSSTFCNYILTLSNLFGKRQSKIVSKMSALRKLFNYDIDATPELYLTVFSEVENGTVLLGPIEAMELYKTQGLRPTSFVFAALLDAYHHLGQPEMALQTLELMELQSIAPTKGMISTVVGSYCRRGKPYVALKWLHMLLVEEIDPSTKAFGYVAARVLEEESSEDLARSLFALMRAFNVVWHNRVAQSVVNAQTTLPHLTFTGEAVRPVKGLAVDSLSGNDFARIVARRVTVPSSIPSALTKEAENADKIDSENDSNLGLEDQDHLQKLVDGEQIEMDQNLILAKLTKLIFDRVEKEKNER